MGLKRYGTDGAWREVENVRRYAAGAGWQDAEFVRRWDGTKWADCWTRINAQKVWQAAQLLKIESRNNTGNGYLGIVKPDFTGNPIYIFCVCETNMSIYKWDGSSLTRLYAYKPDVTSPIFLTDNYNANLFYLTNSEYGNSRTSLYGGTIAAFSFPGIKTETLDEMFAGTTVRASSGNNQSSSPGNPSIGSGSFSDGDFVLVSMRGAMTYTKDNHNFAVNQRTGANTFRTLFVYSENNHPSCLSISNGSGGYVWANGIEPTYNPPKNGTVVALSWGV